MKSHGENEAAMTIITLIHFRSVQFLFIYAQSQQPRGQLQIEYEQRRENKTKGIQTK
jgi:hypothetical protein